MKWSSAGSQDRRMLLVVDKLFRLLLLTAFGLGWPASLDAQRSKDFLSMYRGIRAQYEFSPTKDDDFSTDDTLEEDGFADDRHFTLVYGLDWCFYVQDKDELLYRTKPIAAVLQTFADRESTLSTDLKIAGYPAGVVDQWTHDYELKVLAQGPALVRHINDHAIEDRLFDTINRYRLRFDRDLPRVELDVDCGGHDLTTPVRFKVRPEGRLYVIPDFWFRVCRAQGKDPYDLAACDEWIDVSVSGTVDIGGDYVYQGIWRGLPPRRGLYRVRFPDREDAPVPVVTVTPS